MLIDVHAHLWGGRYEVNKRDILRAMEQYQIDQVFVSGLNGHRPDVEQVEEANRQVADFVRAHPGRIRGYVYVSPEHTNAVEVLRRGIEERGMEGTKFWVSTLCDAPEVDRVAEWIIRYRIPLLVHAFHKATGQYPNESTGQQVAALARRYPEMSIIMAHMGGNCYHGIPAIRACPNVFVDYSGSIFRANELDYALESIGAERILFGTDMPGACLVSLGQLEASSATPYERELICYRNAQRLFPPASLKKECV